MVLQPTLHRLGREVGGAGCDLCSRSLWERLKSSRQCSKFHKSRNLGLCRRPEFEGPELQNYVDLETPSTVTRFRVIVDGVHGIVMP